MSPIATSSGAAQVGQSEAIDMPRVEEREPASGLVGHEIDVEASASGREGALTAMLFGWVLRPARL